MSDCKDRIVEYPCPGDTWVVEGDIPYLTVTGITPTGVIYYIIGLNAGQVTKKMATLGAFNALLLDRGLGNPYYATDSWIKTHGAF